MVNDYLLPTADNYTIHQVNTILLDVHHKNCLLNRLKNVSNYCYLYTVVNYFIFRKLFYNIDHDNVIAP